MEITEVVFDVIKGSDTNLLAFVRVVFDNVFLIRDMKIVRSNDSQKLYVCMPSRKIQDKCHECSGKNCLDASWCNWCGVELKEVDPIYDKNGKEKKEFDICHPIEDGYRRRITDKILSEWEKLMRNDEQQSKGGVSAKITSTG